MNSMDELNLQAIVREELKYSWPLYLTSLLRQVRKRAGIDVITDEHIPAIQAAMASFNPAEQAGALTDDDAVTIANVDK